MLLKVITSIVIIICCAILGIHMSYGYTRRIYNIRDLQSLLTSLETEMIHYSTFLSQAIRNSTKSSSGEWKPFFLEIAYELENKSEYTLSEIWLEALQKLRNHPYIGKVEYEIMYRFGKQLGNSDKESQERYFALAQEQLKIEENDARQICLKYSKMYRSLGLLLGLGIAIILF